MILDDIVACKKKRLIEHKKNISFTKMRKLAVDKWKEQNQNYLFNKRTAEEVERENPFYKALSKDGISIIGEFKKASPSLGNIDSKIDLKSRMKEYNDSMDAISCLTEEDYFLGNIEYLREIRKLSKLPILRKDFMIEAYQFYEAKVIEADAVLLIVAILDDKEMQEFYALSKELGLAALVEVHDEYELERALKIDAQIIGVNNRNLKDFSIHLETTERLSKYIPEDKVFVAESGIVKDEDIKLLLNCKADAFLIGRAFMEAEHPKKLAERWKSL